MRALFHVTYAIYTPESIDNADAAERGFAVAGLCGDERVELAPGICGPEAGAIKARCGVRLRDALRLVAAFDTGGDGFSYYAADNYAENFRDGSHERRDLHLPEGATAASAARVSRLLARLGFIPAREAF